MKELKKVSKSISIAKAKAMRVSYVYLDGSKLTKDEINIIRNTVIEEYGKGISFAQLANKHTMDNTKDGDLGWFDEDVMVKTFEDEIKKHKKGSIFLVDIDENKWYYVVLKTHNDIEKIKLTYILN
jgi:parvulin-like peptidyl-prolyl isomerase